MAENCRNERGEAPCLRDSIICLNQQPMKCGLVKKVAGFEFARRFIKRIAGPRRSLGPIGPAALAIGDAGDPDRAGCRMGLKQNMVFVQLTASLRMDIMFHERVQKITRSARLLQSHDFSVINTMRVAVGLSCASIAPLPCNLWTYLHFSPSVSLTCLGSPARRPGLPWPP